MEAAASVVQMTGGGGRVGMNTDMFLLPSYGPFTSPPGVIVTTGSPNTGVHQYAAATLTLLRRDAWVLPVLILSVLTMTLITTFEVYIQYLLRLYYIIIIMWNILWKMFLDFFQFGFIKFTDKKLNILLSHSSVESCIVSDCHLQADGCAKVSVRRYKHTLLQYNLIITT